MPKLREEKLVQTYPGCGGGYVITELGRALVHKHSK